ncbi:MAG: DUF2848 family protein [Salinigranum sp.]
MSDVTFTVRETDGTDESVTLPIDRIANCGFTGRNEEAVSAHIEELEAEGVTTPDTFPVIYPKPHHLITTDDEIEVLSEHTSGEAEFALFPTGDETYVGVGSDHTDRVLERDDIVVSKAVCQNVVSEDLWAFSEVADHWDEIELRSWTGPADDLQLYQEATLGDVLPPAELLDLVDEESSEPLAGTAVFSGSVGTVSGELVFGDVFKVDLHDPVLDRTLEIEYAVDVLDWM